MCLATMQRKPRISDKDRVVYKVVTKDLKAVYQFFTYVLGALYKTDLKHSLSGTYYSTETREYYQGKRGRVFYGKGFHAFTSKKAAFDALTKYPSNMTKQVVVKCIIPAGSEYVTNKLQQIVSNQLEVVEIMRK